jgi:hypothetical protein
MIEAADWTLASDFASRPPEVNLSEALTAKVSNRKKLDFALATETGRQIPMNSQLFEVLTAHAEWFTSKFGDTRPEYHLFPFGKPTPNDPTRPITDITGAWEAPRKRAGVQCRVT